MILSLPASFRRGMDIGPYDQSPDNFRSVTHGATYIEAAKKGMEVLEMLVQGAEEDGGEPPAPRTFLPTDGGGTPLRGIIISGEDDDDALPYQERIGRLATVKDENEDEGVGAP